MWSHSGRMESQIRWGGLYDLWWRHSEHEDGHYWQDGTWCWATPKDLSRLSNSVLIDTARKVTDAGLRQIPSGLLPKGTVLMSSRAPIGYLVIADVPVSVNQGFIAMVPDRGVPSSYC